MDDLIRRQDAIDAIHQWIEMDKYYHPYSKEKTILVEAAIDEIQRLPSVQKTGKWMWVQYDSISELGDWYCSECRFMPSAFNLAKKHLNYCPSCGARMVGEKE